MTTLDVRRPVSSASLLLGRKILLIGAGGLGCPALLALLDSGATLVIVDDDVVEESNLHRQILFDEDTIGRDKLDAAREALMRRGASAERIELVRSRFLPENARPLAASVDLVIEGSDNFATKFLAADACFLEGRPVVHGAAIRYVATALSVAASGRPCYRCLFEDIPKGAQASCNEAGVLGPVVGICGALLADLAMSALTGIRPRTGRIFNFDGRSNRLRDVEVAARSNCALCSQRKTILKIEETRYTAPSCAA